MESKPLKWEYAITYGFLWDNNLEKRLLECGDWGWELCGYHEAFLIYTLIFKRPKV